MFKGFIYCCFFLFLSTANAEGGGSDFEQRSLRYGFEALQWFELLRGVSNKCDYYEFSEMAKEEEFN